MSIFSGWIRRRLAWLLLGVGLACSGPALADTYNLFLKAPNSSSPDSCATGSLIFTKAGTPPYSATVAASMSLLGCSSLGLPDGDYTGNLTVFVENVSINGETAAPSVVGFSGTLSGPSPTSVATIDFANLGRAATYTPSGSGPTTGAYHFLNTLSVPEPNVLWLLGVALAALLVVRRGRSRR